MKTLTAETVFHLYLKSATSIFRRVLKIAKSDFELRLVCSCAVCPSESKKSAPIGSIFIKFYILGIFRKSVKKILDLLKSGNNEDQCLAQCFVK